MPDRPAPSIPFALREAIARDLRPVAPLARPARRALWLVPFALALLIGSAWPRSACAPTRPCSASR